MEKTAINRSIAFAEEEVELQKKMYDNSEKGTPLSEYYKGRMEGCAFILKYLKLSLATEQAQIEAAFNAAWELQLKEDIGDRELSELTDDDYCTKWGDGKEYFEDTYTTP